MRTFHQTDFEMVKKWYEDREMKCPPMSSFPELGFIIPEVAAGFIAQTDSTVCLLEGYITNPTSSKQERDLALDEITDSLLEAAKELGYQHVLAFTSNTAIEERARAWGFGYGGQYSLMHKELE